MKKFDFFENKNYKVLDAQVSADVEGIFARIETESGEKRWYALTKRDERDKYFGK
jgi:hypothetical protein